MTNNRPMPALTADDRTNLESWLDFYRATLIGKCDGVGEEQIRAASVPPSPLTLQGLVQHMADVERNWFRRILAAEDLPPIFPSEGPHTGGFTASGTFAEARAAWESEVAAARDRAAARALDDTAPFPPGGDVALRWIYTHMISEYARHCGHADLIRERIDGTTGV